MVRITISDLHHINDKNFLNAPTTGEMNTIAGGYRNREIHYPSIPSDLHKKIDDSLAKWMNNLNNQMSKIQAKLDSIN